MYFLLDTCQHPAVLRTLYFGLIIKDIIFTVIPIGIIAMMLVDFSKAVVAGKEDEQQKAVKLIPKRIMYAVIVFTIPWIVNALMKILSSAKLNVALDFNTCIKNARDAEGNFDYYDNLLEEEEKVAGIRSSNPGTTNNDSNSHSSSIGDNSAPGRLIQLINGEVGNTNKIGVDKTRYGGQVGNAWCAYFATWALKKINIIDGKSIYDYLREYGNINDGAASGMWPVFRSGKNENISFNKSKAYGGNYTPKPGDIIWFQWHEDSQAAYCRPRYGKWNGITQCSDHVGIVEFVEGKTIHTIEGNSGGKVSKRTHDINSDTVIAFGSWYK